MNRLVRKRNSIVCMTVLRLRRRQTFYLISSWIIIFIGIGMFFYFMNHPIPKESNEFILAFSVGYAGATILATYKVIGKDQALEEIEELKQSINDKEKQHATCQGRLDICEKQIQTLHNLIIKHINKA